MITREEVMRRFADVERREWVHQSEGLRRRWEASLLPLDEFVAGYRDEIDEVVWAITGRRLEIDPTRE